MTYESVAQPNNIPYKILFIDVVDSKNGFDNSYHPLGIGYISSYIKSIFGKKISVHFANSSFMEKIVEIKPDMVGLSCVTRYYDKAIEIAKFCKSKGITVVIGRNHISTLPESLDMSMDVGVLGEGEETFKEIVDLCLNNKFTVSNISSIEGIVYYDGDTFVRTADREVLLDINTLPFPDRDLFNIKKGDILSIFSSRGCPYVCLFCSSIWKSVRFFSAEYLIGELRYLADKYSPTRITFFDDLFIADKNRLAKLALLISNEHFHNKVKFSVLVRANLVDAETCKLLKYIGVDSVGIGLESMNPRILQYFKGNSVTVEHNMKAVQLFKDYGFFVSGFFVIGAPDETREEMLESLEYIKHSRLDAIDINILCPYPNTPIWDYAVKKGLVSNKMDFSKLIMTGTDSTTAYGSVILSETLSKEDINEVFQLFDSERKRKHRKNMFRSIFSLPYKLLVFISKSLKSNWLFFR